MEVLTELALVYNSNTNSNKFVGVLPDDRYSPIIEDAIFYLYPKVILELQNETHLLTQLVGSDNVEFSLQNTMLNDIVQKFVDIDQFNIQYIRSREDYTKLKLYWVMITQTINSTIVLQNNSLQIDEKINRLNIEINEKFERMSAEKNIDFEELVSNTNEKFGVLNVKVDKNFNGLFNEVNEKILNLETLQKEQENNINSSDAKTLTIMSLFTALIALLMDASGRSAEDIILVMILMTVFFVVIRIVDTFLNKKNLRII